MNSVAFLSGLGEATFKLKGEHLFRQGEQDRSIYVVKGGLLKAYYLDIDGKEQVKSLIQQGELIGSIAACYKGEKCSFSLVCLEDSDLIKVEFDKLQELAANNIDAAQFVIKGLLELAMKKERREFEFLCLSAEERFRLLCERNPALLGRVTQNDIARYLGITPVALSRIKARIATDK